MKIPSTSTIPNRPRSLGKGGLVALFALCALVLAGCGDSEKGTDDDGAAANPARPETRPPGSGDPSAGSPGIPPIGKFTGADASRLSSGGEMRAMMGFPSTDATPRSFRRLSADEKAEMDTLVQRFHDSEDPEERLEILNELDAFYGEAIIGVVAEALKSSDEALRIAAIEMLAGNISAEILDVLRPALDDESVDVRTAAIEAVAQVRDPAVVDFMAPGFADDESDVRHAALIATDGMVDQNKYDLLAAALNSPHADIAEQAIGKLEVEHTRQALETIFEGIDSSNPETRDAAIFSVSWLIDEEFDSAAAARAWWAEHRGEFDRELVRTDE